MKKIIKTIFYTLLLISLMLMCIYTPSEITSKMLNEKSIVELINKQ